MSHRARVTEHSVMLPSTIYGQLPHPTRLSGPVVDKSVTAHQRLSMTSNSSSGRRSSISLNDISASTANRPSGIPRPTKPSSSARLNKLTSARSADNYGHALKATSNITGIAARTALRNQSTEHLAPSNNTPRIVGDDDLLSLEPVLSSLDMDQDAMYGLALPQKQPPLPGNLPPRLIPELQALAATNTTSGLRRPTPAMTINTVSSPSTQFTSTPSPWSASTTATTPTSWSSASPALIQPTRAHSASKRSQTVPIPTTIRTRLPKLPALQESAANSAALSKAAVQSEVTHTPRKTKKKTPLNSPAPTPPPRTSSIKRTRSRSNSNTDEPPINILAGAPPLPREQEASPLEKHIEGMANRPKQPLTTQVLADHHDKLQSAINLIPPRPSRDGIDDLDIRKPQRVNTHRSEYNEYTKKLLDAAPIEALPQAPSQLSLHSARSVEPEPVPTTPSRSRLAKFSKLAIFRKSSKNTPVGPEEEPSPQRRKLQRRGPAAGTGHEGYSKPGRRERRSSNDGNVTGNESESSMISLKRRPTLSRARKDSSTSVRPNNTSQSDLDDFAANRLKPVVMLGGSQKPHGGLHSHPMQDFASNDTTAAVDRSNVSSAQRLQEQDRHMSVTSSGSSGPLLRESRLIFHLDSLDSREVVPSPPRLPQKLDRTENSRHLLQPNHMPVYRPQPYQYAYNTSQSSVAASSIAPTEASNDFYNVDTRSVEKQRKKGRKLNWGFFKRKETTAEPHQPRASSHNDVQKMTVRVSAVQPPRPMPYYAMLETENEMNTAAAIGDFLTEAARALPMDDDEHEEQSLSPTNAPESEPEFERPERTRSVLLPTAPQRKRESVSSRRTAADPITKDMEYSVQPSALPAQASLRTKPSRLPQVGRIPKVVSTTQTKSPARPSFSRPFEQHVEPGNDESFEIAVGLASSPSPIVANTFPRHPLNVRNVQEPGDTPLPAKSSRSVFLNRNFDRDVLKVPDRYSTTSSSSDGVISVMGPPLVPAPEFPLRSFRYTTTEEDIWNEYDELIDRVISPPRLKKSKARITGDDRSQPESSLVSENLRKPYDNSRLPLGLAVDTSLAPPPLLFAPTISLSDHDADEEFHLRRSRIISALHSSMDPSSPFSIGDYLAELGDFTRGSGRTSERLSDSNIQHGGPRSPRTMLTFPELPPTPPTPTEYKHHENAVHMEVLERSKDPVKHAERSYASLMVSRWLSFGRVLFSPAHTDIQMQPERHVLVLDGLGNEDWSIYCAVTYQSEQAYIYDLKETGHTRTSTSPTKSTHTPQNFRRREVSSFNEVFKFPDNFFSVIVLRFPPVMAESKLKNIISECRRVLAPGGYMELMLLDLDIVNMGVCTRRAMRDLKIRISTHNREVSLKPVIDNVQGILGEKGFSKLSRCVVGVPVVGRPPGADSPTSSLSSDTSDRFRKYATAGPRPLDGLDSQTYHNFSLNDLVADHSANADAKIGRMVSRTARSWWQHCFEAAIISDGKSVKSIFADKQVLSECKSRASSFKLLIAYTQKPVLSAPGIRRRTMSEPVVSTLATAGTP